MTKPSKLYKYEPFTAQSLQNLKNQVLYFGSPRNFNDPYDCATSPAFKVPNDEEVERIRARYLSMKDVPSGVHSQFANGTTEWLRQVFLTQAKFVFDSASQDFLSNRGISCFSEVNDSLLMWSHYADCGKGFCLEFRTDLDPFGKIQQVVYSKDMPVIDLVPLLFDDNYEQIFSLYCCKSLDWSYEREWRVAHNESGIAFTYETKALTGVYLGSEMPFAGLEIVALILAGQNESVKIWQGSRSQSKFALEFRPVTYTPHLEAKRKGLWGGEQSE